MEISIFGIQKQIFHVDISQSFYIQLIVHSQIPEAVERRLLKETCFPGIP